MNAENYIHNPKIGAAVYRRGTPQMPGKVTGVTPPDAMGCHQVHVIWLNGEESQISDNLLRDFNGLIKAEEKLLNTYRDLAKKLEKL